MVKSPAMRTNVPFLGLNAPGWRKREQKCNGHATNIAKAAMQATNMADFQRRDSELASHSNDSMLMGSL